MSRTDHSIKNIKFALIFQMAEGIVDFFTRKVFVQVLAKEYLGLNRTFSNILSMLALAQSEPCALCCPPQGCLHSLQKWRCALWWGMGDSSLLTAGGRSFGVLSGSSLNALV